jgi:hypothetical protein
MTSINGTPVELVATRKEDYEVKEGKGSRNRNPEKLKSLMSMMMPCEEILQLMHYMLIYPLVNY